jgi:glycolate oxidase FAD binding subunit
LDGAIYSAPDEGNLWQRLREQIHSLSSELTIKSKIGVLPTAAVEVLTQAQIGLIHVASGLGVLHLENQQQVLQMRNDLVSRGGFLSILEAPADVKQRLDVWGYTGNALPLMRRIKAQFDSENILSPGRFVGGI